MNQTIGFFQESPGNYSINRAAFALMIIAATLILLVEVGKHIMVPAFEVEWVQIIGFYTTAGAIKVGQKALEVKAQNQPA